MQLDDDDYLLPGAGAAMLDAIRRAAPERERAAVRGPHRGRRRRAPAPADVPPRAVPGAQGGAPAAAAQLLVRAGAHRSGTPRRRWSRRACSTPPSADAADTDMWVRLFSRYGVRCLPQTTCAYTIHEAAATTGMWHPGTIRANGEIFDRAVARGIVPERTIRRWQADWYHQFILAGAYRRLRMGRRAEAREVLRLFELPRRPRPGRVAEVAARAGRVHGRHGRGAPQSRKGSGSHERHADRRGRRRWVHRRAPGRQAAEQGYTRIRSVDVKPLDEWYQRFDDVDNRQLDLRRLRDCEDAVDGCERRVQPRGRHGRHGLHREQQGAVHALGADQHAPADGGARRRRREVLLRLLGVRVRRGQAAHDRAGRRAARGGRLSRDARGRLRLGEAVQRADVPALPRGLRHAHADGALPQRLRPARHLGRRAREGAGGDLPQGDPGEALRERARSRSGATASRRAASPTSTTASRARSA